MQATRKQASREIRSEMQDIALESMPQLPDTVTPAPNSEEIAALAHSYWLERGCPEGSPEIDWFRAEEEVNTRCAA